MKIPHDWSNMAESWTLADKASGRILNALKLPNKIEWQALQWVVPEKIRTPPDGWDSRNSRGRGGQRPWKSRQEGG